MLTYHVLRLHAFFSSKVFMPENGKSRLAVLREGEIMGEGAVLGDETEDPLTGELVPVVNYRTATASVVGAKGSARDSESSRRNSATKELWDVDLSSGSSSSGATFLTLSRELCQDMTDRYPQFRERVQRQKNNFRVLGHKSLRTQKKWFRSQQTNAAAEAVTAGEISAEQAETPRA
jgi:hypothetical protein